MYNRRTFLKHSCLVAAGLLFAEKNHANSNYPVISPKSDVNCIRINGIVRADNRGIADVCITDGLSVTRTRSDGTFTLNSNSHQRFVIISLPSGYAIPTGPTGTALLYLPIKLDKNSEMTAEFNLRKLEYSDENHSFFVLADIHAHDLQVFHSESVPDIQTEVKRLSELSIFGVSCGDMMSNHLEFFPNYERGVKSIGIPFFQVLGNHDQDIEAMTDDLSCSTFMKHFGPTYYSFNKGKIHYVVLDDIFWYGDYIGYIDQKQLNWLEADLAFIEKGRTVVVFVHIPVYCKLHLRNNKTKPSNRFVVTNRELLYELLEPFNSIIICGHTHESEYLNDGGAEIHIGGAVCGAWWSGPICSDGTPKGYSIYRADGERLSRKYKSIGKDENYQMSLYRLANSQGSDEIIANVWSADSYWKVFWYEDSIRKGIMNKKLGYDPFSIELYQGSQLPSGKEWIEPSLTDHLFYAKPSKISKSIVIEVNDRWGHIFAQKLND